MPTQNLALTQDELTLLVKSLDHCLATCSKKAGAAKDAPCGDCDKARRLRDRLAALT